MHITLYNNIITFTNSDDSSLHGMYNSENNVQNETWVVFTGDVTVVITLEIKSFCQTTRKIWDGSRGKFLKMAMLSRCVSLERRVL